ncbi:MAG: DUF6607 family protein [Pseudomonadota bacterium]
MTGTKDELYVVKRWRQDWEYEPSQILAYQGDDIWKRVDVPEAMRAGRWSQTVYQAATGGRH